MVLGNRISKFFKEARNKLFSSVKKETVTEVLKAESQKVSETIDTKRRKHKTRWSKQSWLSRIFASTSEKLTEEQRKALAKGWIGTFSPVRPFRYVRGSRTSKTQRGLI